MSPPPFAFAKGGVFAELVHMQVDHPLETPWLSWKLSSPFRRGMSMGGTLSMKSTSPASKRGDARRGRT